MAAIIDLHTHSTASDGTLSPRELVELASRQGIKGLALTDHDTTSGLEEAREAAERLDITFVPGVEVSAHIERGALHILGLHIDPQNPELQALLDWLIAAREERNHKQLQKLSDLGLPLTLKEVREIAGTGATGRPHIAQAMVQRGYVKNQPAAFKKYLGSRGSAHVQRRKPPIDRAIGAIRNAGGVPILAHPDQTLKTGRELERFVGDLRDSGLAGIEVYYSGYTQSQVWEYKSLAQTYHLVLSGGSDFHGAIKPGIQLGRGPGALYVPDSLLKPLALRAAEIRQPDRHLHAPSIHS